MVTLLVTAIVTAITCPEPVEVTVIAHVVAEAQALFDFTWVSDHVAKALGPYARINSKNVSVLVNRIFQVPRQLSCRRSLDANAIPGCSRGHHFAKPAALRPPAISRKIRPRSCRGASGHPCCPGAARCSSALDEIDVIGGGGDQEHRADTNLTTGDACNRKRGRRGRNVYSEILVANSDAAKQSSRSTGLQSA
jgi:hypothetical protein